MRRVKYTVWWGEDEVTLPDFQLGQASSYEDGKAESTTPELYLPDDNGGFTLMQYRRYAGFLAEHYSRTHK